MSTEFRLREAEEVAEHHRFCQQCYEAMHQATDEQNELMRRYRAAFSAYQCSRYLKESLRAMVEQAMRQAREVTP